MYGYKARVFIMGDWRSISELFGRIALLYGGARGCGGYPPVKLFYSSVGSKRCGAVLPMNTTRCGWDRVFAFGGGEGGRERQNR
jgi:hypothetical protein